MKIKLDKKGVTAIEALIGIGLIAVIVMAVYNSLTGTMSHMNESKIRIGALALANEKMEIVHNLPYDQIGTIEGIIPGPLYQTEQLQKNNYNYNIKTEVRYLDDPSDDIFPNDLLNNDYKQVHIEVDWGIPEKVVSLYSVFVPEGIETAVNGGTLSINVLDSSGIPVPAVSIHIQSIDDNPVINYNTGTDDLGGLVLPGVPGQNYRITLSKDDYESVRTYPNPPDSNFTPLDSDVNVIADYLTTKTFFMDRTANLTLKALNIGTNDGIDGIAFHIVGGKKIGVDPETFNIDETESTNSSGEAVFSNISPGSYQIANLASLDTSNYAYVGTSESLPLEIYSSEDKTVEFLFADKDTDSLAVVVKDEITGEVLSGATVKLTGNNSDFEQTVVTGSEGIAFFPQSPEILLPDSYSLTVSLDGYSDYDDGSVEIEGLKEKEVLLHQ